MHGLFFWSPLLMPAAVGLLWLIVQRRDGWLVCALASAGTLWYLNSAWHCWWFGHAFGGRAFLELAGFFALGMAGVLEGVAALGAPARRLVAGAVGAAVGYQFVLMGLYVMAAIPRGDALFYPVFLLR